MAMSFKKKNYVAALRLRTWFHSVAPWASVSLAWPNSTRKVLVDWNCREVNCVCMCIAYIVSGVWNNVPLIRKSENLVFFDQSICSIWSASSSVSSIMLLFEYNESLKTTITTRWTSLPFFHLILYGLCHLNDKIFPLQWFCKREWKYKIKNWKEIVRKSHYKVFSPQIFSM